MPVPSSFSSVKTYHSCASFLCGMELIVPRFFLVVILLCGAVDVLYFCRTFGEFFSVTYTLYKSILDEQSSFIKKHLSLSLSLSLSHTHTHTRAARTHTHTHTPVVYGTQHLTGFASHTPLLIKNSEISSALPG